MQAVLISAPHKSSGKTMIALGLARLLRDKGLKVQMFKKGPDYIDPIWHRQASGRPSYNLDFNTQSRDEILQLFASKSADADVVLVEGNHGLFDGQDIEGEDSNAALAHLLHLPVMLVVDVTGFTRGLAPLLQGYAAFDPRLCFQGVLLNKCAGPRHRQRLQAVCERYAPMPLLGVLSRWKSAPVQERHLGLQPANETGDAEAVIQRFARRLAEEMDVDAWLSTLPTYRLPAVPEAEPVHPSHAGLRIGLLRDEAFGFYYPDDLEYFQRCGVELVELDGLRDTALPALDGLLIGGGFPEMKAEGLSRNRPLRHAVKQALENGLPCYAECGGLMYLCEAIVTETGSWPMVGLLPARAEMCVRPVGRGLVELERDKHPWPWPGQHRVQAHEFHHSRWQPLEKASKGLHYAWQVKRGHGINGRQDGVIHGNTIAGYTHLRHTRASPWVDAFLNFVRERKHD